MTIPHARPTEERLYVERQSVDGTCPECGESRLQAYPVLSDGGWFDVVKCANCLHSVSREKGPKLGAVELLSDQI